jgi:hypothetical protein
MQDGDTMSLDKFIADQEAEFRRLQREIDAVPEWHPEAVKLRQPFVDALKRVDKVLKKARACRSA